VGSLDKEGAPAGRKEWVIRAKDPRGEGKGQGNIVEIVPEAGSSRISNGGDIRGGQGRGRAMGPQAAPTILHGIQSRQAHKGPHRRGQGRGGRKQEPEGGPGERGRGQGRGNL
jgi:hypothetical protein